MKTLLIALLTFAAGLCLPATADVVVKHESFFVGGKYTGSASAQVMQGQMFVEALTPQKVIHPYPLVFIHGGAQTAMNWMTTPDGREGWAQWFTERGWKVYLVDQPARGRSAWQPGINGDLKSATVQTIERYFTAPESFNAWPQAKLHTQWPGGPHKGRAGQAAFDQFYASQVPSIERNESEDLMQAAGAALLDRIGPAVLVVHSQSGLLGWLIADVRPASVKGIVSIEPSGPPFMNTSTKHAAADRPFGLTSIPLTFDPPVTTDAPIAYEQQAQPDAPDLVACWSEKGTPHRLKNLVGIPTLVATSEASYHAMYDHCTSRFLTRAGVTNEFVRLADHGIHGNGHMMMLEANNLAIANFLEKWILANVK